jgi:hypothetical protein
MTFTVYTTAANHPGKVFAQDFDTAHAAERFIIEEMKWESTVSVSCPELGIEVEGDYVGVSHTFA